MSATVAAPSVSPDSRNSVRPGPDCEAIHSIADASRIGVGSCEGAEVAAPRSGAIVVVVVLVGAAPLIADEDDGGEDDDGEDR
ncbi:hypothetical protein DN539_35025, partial [Burkholderia multivorans]